jgi:predicted AAA+ superfamily ATPase
MVRGYAEHYRLRIADEELQREALAWALGRGARSGRVALQYIQDLAGRLGVRLDGMSER